MGQTQQLSQKLNAAGASMVPAVFEQNIKQWYVQNRKRILALVGGQEDRAALYIAAAFAQVNKLPELINCTPESFYQCLIFSMGTSLLPGPMQECVFIPFKSEATFIPMYGGLVKLAYNSGYVTRISSHVVWEADQFEYDPAKEEIYHRPFMGAEKDRGKRIAAYCCIKNRYGEIQPMVKYAEFVASIKARSRGAKSNFSPWNSDYPSDVDAMWLKTAFKQAAKWIPKSATPDGLRLGHALDLDNAADADEPITVSLLQDELETVKRDVIEAPRVAKRADTEPEQPPPAQPEDPKRGFRD